MLGDALLLSRCLFLELVTPPSLSPFHTHYLRILPFDLMLKEFAIVMDGL